MRALIQRVSEASVTIEGKIHSSIDEGLLIFLGVESSDEKADIDWLTKKIVQLRIFSDEQGQMNKSLLDKNGMLLVISQFTLFANTKKGNRPSFIQAAPPRLAIPLYESFIESCKVIIGDKKVRIGIFGAEMRISLVNEGPVTIWLDSKRED